MKKGSTNIFLLLDLNQKFMDPKPIHLEQDLGIISKFHLKLSEISGFLMI